MTLRQLVPLCYLLISTCSFASGSVSHNKFKQWYPFYGPTLDRELQGIAGYGYNDCKPNITAYDSTTTSVDATSLCYNVYDCLYAGLLPNIQSNFASAQVLLGLTPTLLTTIAPSLGEMSMLSSQRPCLSFLLSLGGPAVFIDRLLGYSDPLESLKHTRNIFTFSKEALRVKGISTCLSMMEYIVAVAAIVNVVHASWQLGFRTVIAWKCNSSYLPFLWSTLPIVMHGLSAGSWHCSKTMAKVRRTKQLLNRSHKSSSDYLHGILPEWFLDRLRDEVRLSHNQPRYDYRSSSKNTGDISRVNQPGGVESWWVILMVESAEAITFVHVVFGTLVLSSLQFIGTLDAVTVIARYIASGFVCRFVLMFELSGMKLVENETGSETLSSSHMLLQSRSSDDGTKPP